VELRFTLRDKPAEDVAASLELTTADGKPVCAFVPKPEKDKGQRELKLDAGINTVRWDLQYPDAETFDGMVLWGGGTDGPKATPGKYKAHLKIGEQASEVEFEILKDPRLTTTESDYREQFEFLIQVRDKLTEVHRAIKQIRDVRGQIDSLKTRLGGDEKFKPVVEQATKLAEQLTTIEKALYQTESKSSQDPLNFPMRLNNRLSALVNIASSADARPTQQVVALRDELVKEIDGHLGQLKQLISAELSNLNNAIRGQEIPPIFSEPPKPRPKDESK
jgi:hypothetical protein